MCHDSEYCDSSFPWQCCGVSDVTPSGALHSASKNKKESASERERARESEREGASERERARVVWRALVALHSLYQTLDVLMVQCCWIWFVWIGWQ